MESFPNSQKRKFSALQAIELLHRPGLFCIRLLFAKYCVVRHGEHPSSCSGAGERNPLPKNSGGFQCEMHVIEVPGEEDSIPGWSSKHLQRFW